jgi:hypothetical protein
MNYLHKDLANGKWKSLSFLQQMANIGSEVERAINWRIKGNQDYSLRAFERALELFDLTINQQKTYPKILELVRARELFVDYIFGNNIYHSTDKVWQNYFMNFTCAAIIEKK